jgi:hypothetical protein
VRKGGEGGGGKTAAFGCVPVASYDVLGNEGQQIIGRDARVRLWNADAVAQQEHIRYR